MGWFGVVGRLVRRGQLTFHWFFTFEIGPVLCGNFWVIIWVIIHVSAV